MSETVQTRASAYMLLAHLLGREPDEELFQLLRSDEEITTWLPPGDDQMMMRALRSEFTRLFQMEVFPYESVFCSDEVELFTESTFHVQAFYQACRFQPDPRWRVAAPDHIAVELHFLSALCSVAINPSVTSTTAPHLIDSWQWQFLVQHVIQWLPVLTLVIRRAARGPFYPRVLDMACELVFAHATEFTLSFSNDCEKLPPQRSTTSHLPLQDAALNEVVRFLTTPVHCGLFISRADLSRLAYELGGSLGFTSRRSAMHQLFEEAARADSLPDLLHHIRQLVAGEIAAYACWQTQFPQLQSLLAATYTRLTALHTSLEHMTSLAELSATALPETAS
jgi:TorA maturation chaperone TorD